jgi:hypothetical protein
MCEVPGHRLAASSMGDFIDVGFKISNIYWKETTVNDYYGENLKNLGEALVLAEDKGWITGDEARKEFRAKLDTTRENDYKKANAAELRFQADKLEADS